MSPMEGTHHWLEVLVGVGRRARGVGRPEMHIGTMVVWSPGVGLGVWQAWRASQDVVCPPGPLCGVVVSPPGVRAALVQLHHWGLQDGHFIVLWTGLWPRIQRHVGHLLPLLPFLLLGFREVSRGLHPGPGGTPRGTGRNRVGDPDRP
jgi:hypothetical protein